MLTGPPPWPSGLAAAVAAGLALWVVGARLRLRPASRAAAIALYATAVLLVEWYSPDGVDGRAALLLALAGCAAVGGRARSALAGLACAAAVLVAPVAAVGFLALLGAMASAGAFAGRWGPAARRALAAVAFVAAGAVAVAELRPGLPLALPVPVLAGLTLWGLLLCGLLWRRLAWLRPVAVAVLALLGCAWTPGPGADAVVLAAGAVALLSAVLAEEVRVLLARRVLAAGVSVAAAVTGLLAPGASPPEPVPTPPVPVAETRPAVRPVAIRVPALGVDGPLGELTADPATGELAAPDDPGRAGWFAGGVVPGERGPAVVGGHVDSRAGPGVFAGLRTLRPGDLVEVTRSDGSVARFTVTAVRLFPKDRFPTEAVYGPAPGPELRLVTCGGRFDRAVRSYEDNVVVDAVLV